MVKRKYSNEENAKLARWLKNTKAGKLLLSSVKNARELETICFRYAKNNDGKIAGLYDFDEDNNSLNWVTFTDLWNELGLKSKKVKSILIVEDFFNKLAGELDKKYFPEVKYYHDNKSTQKIHYAIELFNNGCLTYNDLIKKLSAACKETQKNIHTIVSKYIKDFGDFKFKVK